MKFKKIKLPWYTCSRVVEMYGDMGELEVCPKDFLKKSFEALKRINESGTKEKTMKYAVAYMSYFDNDLKITIVEANDPITALIEGARILMEASDNDPWLSAFLENISKIDDYDKRIEEIKEDFFNADQSIAIIQIS